MNAAQVRKSYSPTGTGSRLRARRPVDPRAIGQDPLPERDYRLALGASQARRSATSRRSGPTRPLDRHRPLARRRFGSPPEGARSRRPGRRKRQHALFDTYLGDYWAGLGRLARRPQVRRHL
ncbi:hypothetical protein ACRAWD_26505 [Caulobacter segnis]